MLPYLPAKGLIRYLSTRTATAIKLPDTCDGAAPPAGGRMERHLSLPPGP
jgi:hypothetical protein